MDKQPTFPALFAKITVAHMITYMFVGIIVLTVSLSILGLLAPPQHRG